MYDAVGGGYYESITVKSGAKSKAFVPSSTILTITTPSGGSTANGVKFRGTGKNSDDSYKTGFATIADATGFKVHWTGSYCSTKIIEPSYTIRIRPYYKKVTATSGTSGTIAKDYTKGNTGGGIRISSAEALTWSTGSHPNGDRRFAPIGKEVSINSMKAAAGFKRVKVEKDGKATTNAETAKVTMKADHDMKVYYDPIVGKLTITKVNSEATGTKLSGAKFTLSGTSVFGKVSLSGTTNGNGQLTFSNIPYTSGSYTLKETTAPKGYNGVNRTWKVTVNGSGTVTVSGTGASGSNGNYTITNAPIKKSYTITKVDASDQSIKLSGAKFQLYASNGTTKIGGVQTTSVNGTVTFSNLPYGTYILKEESEPTGYIASNKQWTVKIDDTITISGANSNGSNGSFTITNAPVNLTITKVDSEDTANKLSGAEFTLSGGSITKTATTGADGTAVIRAIPAGSYTLTETKAPYGFNGEGRTWSVNVTAAGEVTVNGTAATRIAANSYQITNAPKKNNFTITKTDSVTGETLSGAQFQLYMQDGTTKVGGVQTTGADGKVTFSGIKYGTYKLKEEKPAAQHRKNTTVWTVTVDDTVTISGDSATGSNGSFTITNEPVEVTIIKVDAAKTTTKLSGAVFTLHDDSTGALVASVTTSASGEVTFKKLQNGATYTLREITPPVGYRISGTGAWKVTVSADGEVTVSVISGGNVTKLRENMFQIADPRISTRLWLTKTDSETGAGLSGAVFTLTGTSGYGESVNLQASTRSDGSLAIMHIPYSGSNTYTLTEKTPPRGYLRNDKYTWEVTVDSNGVLRVDGKVVDSSNPFAVTNAPVT